MNPLLARKLKECVYGHCLNTSFLRVNRYTYSQLRYKKKERSLTKNIDNAMEYFDSVYSPIYGRQWERIRKVLGTDPKYCAYLNNFTDSDFLADKFKELGAFNVGDFYKRRDHHYTWEIDKQENSQFESQDRLSLESNEDLDVDSRLIKGASLNDKRISDSFEHVPATNYKGLDDWVEEADTVSGLIGTPEEENLAFKVIREVNPLPWPENIHFFAFVRGEESRFPSPRHSSELNKFTHYIFNGSSILPVIALDVQLGDKVLDMCSAPGGKALAILQTLKPGQLVCNDVSQSRLNRVEKVFKEYIHRDLDSIWDIIDFTKTDGRGVAERDYFDRVLVDAPCLNDRLSLLENDNSIFKSSRTEERLLLPELQAALIVSALKSVRPGGCVVYATCTLAPIQNDGAVHLALSNVWKETQMDVSVMDMSQTMKRLGFMFKVGHHLGLRYGHVVLPTASDNYGPMYISKIIRNR